MAKKHKREEFFNEMYNESFYNLRMYVRKRSCDSFIVDDILQEVYYEAFRHIEDLMTHENYIGWLYKTADNKIKKLNSVYYKHIMYETTFDETYENLVSMNDESDIILYDEYRRILSEDEYNLIMKKYREGYTHQELAKMTGNTVAGNKMKISRIIKKLKNKIKIQIFLLFFFFS